MTTRVLLLPLAHHVITPTQQCVQGHVKMILLARVTLLTMLVVLKMYHLFLQRVLMLQSDHEGG